MNRSVVFAFMHNVVDTEPHASDLLTNWSWEAVTSIAQSVNQNTESAVLLPEFAIHTLCWPVNAWTDTEIEVVSKTCDRMKKLYQELLARKVGIED